LAFPRAGVRPHSGKNLTLWLSVLYVR
jgi:hypothetical protein